MSQRLEPGVFWLPRHGPRAVSMAGEGSCSCEPPLGLALYPPWDLGKPILRLAIVFELGDCVLSIFGVLRQWMDSSAVCLSIGLGFALMIWPNSDHAKMSALSFPPIWHQSCSLDANSIRACCLRKQNTLGGGPRPSAFVLLLRCHSGDLNPLYPSSSPLRSSPKTSWLHRRWLVLELPSDLFRVLTFPWKQGQKLLHHLP